MGDFVPGTPYTLARGASMSHSAHVARSLRSHAMDSQALSAQLQLACSFVPLAGVQAASVVKRNGHPSGRGSSLEAGGELEAGSWKLT
jgi:hypothetical protein